MARLGDATWPDAQVGGTLLVPIGSIEQHGPHLPLDTDTAIAEAVTALAAEHLERAGRAVWVGPALAYTSSGEHQSFAGTLSIGAAALETVVLELVRSASTWVSRTVLVNAHGGNAPVLTRAVKQLVVEGHDVSWVPCRTEAVDLHAGRTETSLMLHLRSTSVRIDRAAAGDPRPLRKILPTMMAGGVAAVSESGVLGDPAGASAAEGAALVEQVAAEVAAAVSDSTVGGRP